MLAVGLMVGSVPQHFRFRRPHRCDVEPCDVYLNLQRGSLVLALPGASCGVDEDNNFVDHLLVSSS